MQLLLMAFVVLDAASRVIGVAPPFNPLFEQRRGGASNRRKVAPAKPPLFAQEALTPDTTVNAAPVDESPFPAAEVEAVADDECASLRRPAIKVLRSKGGEFQVPTGEYCLNLILLVCLLGILVVQPILPY